jgi:fibronectin-binding autotransporter adhesin
MKVLRIFFVTVILTICPWAAGNLPAQQTNFSVSSAAELSSALAQAAINSSANASLTNTITLTGDIWPTNQMFVNANVNIVGGGYTIDLNNADRAFFIAGGTVSITNLTIANSFAQGGNGADAGGGGAGLGGAIFVANGSSITGSNVTLPTVVTLGGITFTNNTAAGGNGGNHSVSAAGGGGGMGGNGGEGNFGTLNGSGGGGGGGFGVGADGGTAAAGGAGTFLGGASGGESSSGFAGGPNGGGGGGATGDTNVESSNIGGGAGGVAGQPGSAVTGNGGMGGFGGGGGGSGLFGYTGGYGGFGGGGGAGNGEGGNEGSLGGNGGFGGGGGFGVFNDTPQSGGGAGGFGAGGGARELNFPINPATLYGGGGLGAGGAVFVMNGATVVFQNGSFSANVVTPGSGSTNGSAYGSDVFLGADATYQVDASTTVSLNLGGAGNLNDPNVANAPAHQLAQADGGIIKTGSGTLSLTGTNFYTGPTIVQSGTLELASGATQTGTTQVIVGQNSGDNGLLYLDGGSRLTGGSLLLGQSAGSSGALIFGAGNAATVDFGTTPITGGDGGGTIVFSQSLSADGLSGTFEFTPVINGNISIIQGGTGTTRLAPGGVVLANHFSGSIDIVSGTLEIGNVDAIPTTTELTVNGGTLNLNGYDGFFSQVELNGGSIINSGGPAAFTANQVRTFSGQIHAPITGNSDGTFVLGQIGSGTTTIVSGGASNILGGDVEAEAGQLVIGQDATLLHIENLTLTGSGSIIVQSRLASQTQNVSIGEDANGTSNLVIDGGELRVTGSNGVVLGQSGSLTFNGTGGVLETTQISPGANGSGTLVFAQSDTRTVMPIGGSFSLVQSGPGTTILHSQITSGSTTISAGTLTISTSEEFFNLSSDSTIQMTGGILDISTINVQTQNFVMTGGTLSGTARLASSSFITASAGTVDAIAYAEDSFIKDGDGTLAVVSNGNVIANTVQINGGILTVSGGGVLESNTSITLAGGRLQIGTGGLVDATNIDVSTGAVLELGTSGEPFEGLGESVLLALNGGALETTFDLTQTLSGLTINGPSLVNFSGNSAALTFGSLTLSDTLAIWNYSANTTLTISGGTALGDLSNISFYSDNGQTFLGAGEFSGNIIVPVPEPSTYALFVMAVLLFAIGSRMLRRIAAASRGAGHSY